MNRSLMWMWAAILSCGLVMVSCSDDDNNSSSGREETVVMFTDCGSEFTYGSVEAMLHELLVKYDIPVLCGFPAGHDDVNLPLVMGAPVTIDVRNDGATLQFDIEGVQREVNTADITAAQTPAAVRMRLAGKRE